MFILSSAEEYNLSGVIVDSSGQKIIDNVNIVLDGTDIGTTSNANGYFQIKFKSDNPDQQLIFKHISYLPKKISLREMKSVKKIQLVRTTIILSGVDVAGRQVLNPYQQDLYNVITRVTAEDFESKGYIDVADVIAGDQSISVKESLNGRKTVSVRGTNAYEVLVLYDGIKINNNFDNMFDLSIIDPSGLQQIDIIKGSNSAGLGAFGSSAVINFIPKLEQDYLLRFSQRIGSYDSGDWSLNFYKKFYGLKVHSAIKQGGATQQYAESETAGTPIFNKNLNASMNISYDFPRQDSGESLHQIKAKYIYSERDYDNKKYIENLRINHSIRSLKYSGNFQRFGGLNLVISDQKLNETHSWKTAYSVMHQIYNHMDNSWRLIWDTDYFKNQQGITDNSTQIKVDHSLKLEDINIFTAYKHNDSRLKYRNKLKDLSADDFIPDDETYYRNGNAFSASIQFFTLLMVNQINITDLSCNISFETVNDELPKSFDPDCINRVKESWKESSSMFLVAFELQPETILFSGYFSYGINYTIPTLYQQISARLYRLTDDREMRLYPETKKNFEFGYSIINVENNIPQFEIAGAFFQNSYINKFREIYVTGSPITFFDNHTKTKNMGFETAAAFFFFNRSMILNISHLRNFFSDVIAFPFKPDQKVSAGLTWKYKKSSVKLILFKESGSAGAVIDRAWNFREISLDEFSNVDLHIEQTFKLWRMNTFASFSGRNLFSNKAALEGIALRDRRFYFTIGFEYL